MLEGLRLAQVHALLLQLAYKAQVLCGALHCPPVCPSIRPYTAKAMIIFPFTCLGHACLAPNMHCT